jgi:hypothetical protein
MLFRLLLAIIVIAVVIVVIRHIRRQPPQQRPRIILKYGLYLLAIIMLGLVVSGKVHWIAAAVAALLPAVQKLFYTAIRFLPFLHHWQKNKRQQHADNSGGKMTLEQAKGVFGLTTIDNVEQVTKRHRELMQKMHPDRGGSDYLAAQINQAKDILIDHLKQR